VAGLTAFCPAGDLLRIAELSLPGGRTTVRAASRLMLP